jgi:two-component system, chemotaxis family, protein-glutamate methylesterase/glutaminase
MEQRKDMEESPLAIAEHILVIGGSAGSLDVLLHVLPQVKRPLRFAIIIVLHRKSSTQSSLSDLFVAKTKHLVKEADDKEKIQKGIIYLAPADYHLLIEEDRTFAMDDSEKVNFSRPSIDVTFETAAEVFKDKLTCLLLSGANNDGTEGLKRVKALGGRIWIQDPKNAEVSQMPKSALNSVKADAILDEEKMADFINCLD